MNIQKVKINLLWLIDNIDISTESKRRIECGVMTIEQQQEEIERLENPWISIKDRLPIKDEFYLCYEKNAMNLRTSIIVSSFDTVTRSFNHSSITHWQPLPSPPPKQNQEK